MNVLFVAGFGPIVRDDAASRKLYIETLGLPLKQHSTNLEYFHTDKIDGVKEYALWPLSQAADSCFGSSKWPTHLPVPQAWIEFDVEDINSATQEMKAKGHDLLVSLREEPWGQTVTRFLSPEGLLVGLSRTPWLRKAT
jgi:catechol 2,3-dioxygenase-like lactoylglutathione lyase family enzyme